ncbi:MAG: hypothetical protein ACK6DP_05155 [Gemmatimonas sp.]|jgi:hypothetical protein|uniref:hypothetical protein n=1 Tax=Gemmatimonas sp. TaxID=1962908 RepID=UPI00391EF40A
MSRGRLLTAGEVIARYFPAGDGERSVTPRWVYAHVFPRVDLARGVVRYYEADVEAWLESRRRAA